jgi:hypothetical protein
MNIEIIKSGALSIMTTSCIAAMLELPVAGNAHGHPPKLFGMADGHQLQRAYASIAPTATAVYNYRQAYKAVGAITNALWIARSDPSPNAVDEKTKMLRELCDYAETVDNMIASECGDEAARRTRQELESHRTDYSERMRQIRESRLVGEMSWHLLNWEATRRFAEAVCGTTDKLQTETLRYRSDSFPDQIVLPRYSNRGYIVGDFGPRVASEVVRALGERLDLILLGLAHGASPRDGGLDLTIRILREAMSAIQGHPAIGQRWMTRLEERVQSLEGHRGQYVAPVDGLLAGRKAAGHNAAIDKRVRSDIEGARVSLARILEITTATRPNR